MEVHMVSIGVYSDYRVLGVFSTQEKAEQYIETYKAISRGYYDEPFLDAVLEVDKLDELNAIVQQEQGKLPFTVYMHRNGDCDVSAADMEYFSLAFHDTNELYPLRNSRCRRLVCDVWAKDKEGAAKIANERRLAMIMNGAWPEEPEEPEEPQRRYGEIPF